MNIHLHTIRFLRMSGRCPRPGERGFSLVEVTIALGLVAFCLVALLGLVPVGMSQEKASFDQLGAMHVMSSVSSDFQGRVNEEGVTERFAIPVQSGAAGSFFINHSLVEAAGAQEAEFIVFYRIHGGGSGQNLHLSIARADGRGAAALADSPRIAEGIIHRRNR